MNPGASAARESRPPDARAAIGAFAPYATMIASPHTVSAAPEPRKSTGMSSLRYFIYVFCSFFFAAGKRMLLRISRYPGEFG